MDFAATAVLGGIAGFTIYLGLPFARLRNLTRAWQTFLNAIAIGILVFLLWDVISAAVEPIDAAMVLAKEGAAGSFALLLVLFVFGFGFGLLTLVYIQRWLIRSKQRGTEQGTMTAGQLATMIAVGIGVHNFSEGLVIGQASQQGAVGLATILIVGFGLHNATEGFGIAAPLTAAQRPSWGFLALLGLIAGGPTFIGTLIGFNVYSEPVYVLCLALAAGSILYVIAELLHIGHRFNLREIAMWGVVLGFVLAFGTDLILAWGGL